jgi:hydroxymethylpyrimidine pyrophosphatase-like HAD family hydrolase
MAKTYLRNSPDQKWLKYSKRLIKMSKYKVVAFDLDGTLAQSKSKVPLNVANALDRLMCNRQVAVISGGAWKQFEKQLLPYLTMAPHCLPTCGTTYYKYEYDKGAHKASPS